MSAVTDEQQIKAFSIARMARDKRFDGVFFIAVKSTNIFCRSICPANLPKEENVTYYHLAEQALEAGYRPCLRCRPDSAPGSPAWLGVNTTVLRAMQLLACDYAQSIVVIAERLGVSDRYLRKLMMEHIGLAPKQYRLYQQVLFAKRLLQSTSLTVTDVALASGFQSARSLQQQCNKHLRLSPSDLRTRGKQMSTPGITVFLSYRAPYNWEQVWRFLAKRQLAGIETVNDTGYSRRFVIDGVGGQVTATHDSARNGFHVNVQISQPKLLKQVLDNVRRVLDLDADPKHIETALVQSGLNTEQLVSGLRLPGCWSAFEAACRAITGQQVSVAGAVTKLQQIIHWCWQQTGSEPYFPTPEALLQAGLDGVNLPRARKAALLATAEYFATLAVDTELDEKAVLAIKGIGPWTLNYMLMRGLSHPDIYLEGDLIVEKVAQHSPLQPSLAAPWRSYLTFQLWQLSETTI